MKKQAAKFKAPLSSANANNGGNAGITYVNANNSAANANANIGFQLRFYNMNLEPYLLVKNKSTHTSFGSISEKDGNLKQMKRINNLFSDICSIENLKLAEKKARHGKANKYGVKVFDKNAEINLQKLHSLLLSGEFKTSQYKVFQLTTPNGKVRDIYRLPYYPDRIVHHAIMNVLEPVWVSTMTKNTYSCIKKRGIHSAATDVKETLTRFPEDTTYCLKLDIRKYYPSIDHDILKIVLRKKIKDGKLLQLLDEIIDSAPGVPIGNYLSQYFANLYLTGFDHWIKETQHIKHYFRYADDIVILASTKTELHQLFIKIQEYLVNALKLTIKSNYQIFPVSIRGIDFVGYRFFHTHTLLRKSIKTRFAKAVSKNKTIKLAQLHCGHYGWAKHCNSINLLKKLSA